jgi:esterase/lipase superfamily enzyme
MGIILSTGEWDMCLNDNIILSNILNSKGITHWLDIKKWAGHDWQWWHMMFPEYLSQVG